MTHSREMTRLLGYIHKKVDRSFTDLIEEPWGKVERPQWHPLVDVYETADAYLLVIDLPGVRPEDVEVQPHHQGVVVCGRREATHSYSSANQIMVERRSGRFCRKVVLAHPVDTELKEIRYEHGLCEIILPKKH
ncbi:MAG: Hsp20/alpha crystallin family protein [Chitinivibrionales bacterium]